MTPFYGQFEPNLPKCFRGGGGRETLESIWRQRVFDGPTRVEDLRALDENCLVQCGSAICAGDLRMRTDYLSSTLKEEFYWPISPEEDTGLFIPFSLDYMDDQKDHGFDEADFAFGVDTAAPENKPEPRRCMMMFDDEENEEEDFYYADMSPEERQKIDASMPPEQLKQAQMYWEVERRLASFRAMRCVTAPSTTKKIIKLEERPGNGLARPFAVGALLLIKSECDEQYESLISRTCDHIERQGHRLLLDEEIATLKDPARSSGSSPCRAHQFVWRTIGD